MALVLLLGGWIGIRAMVLTGEAQAIAAPGVARFSGGVSSGVSGAPAAEVQLAGWCPLVPPVVDLAPIAARCGTAAEPVRLAGGSVPPSAAGASGAPGAIIDHGFMLAPGHEGQKPVATVREDVPTPASVSPAALAGEPRSGRRRWSVDAWMFVRRGEGALTLGTMTPFYGASQYGVVVRRAFGSGPRPRAFAYARVAGATEVLDRQVALGLGVRPLRAVPVAVLAEGRLQQDLYGKHVRPAAALVSEVPPVKLPLGLTGDVYGQAGWVGGRGATPFFDAQAVVDRGVVRAWRGTDVRLGGGVWGGGQKGAVRLDVGPRASIRTHMKGWPVQVSADYRFRIAGHAAPGSGPAVTLSTGF